MDKARVISMSLTDKQVEERIKQGKVNEDSSVPTKTVRRIIYDNVVTLFNIVNIILFLLLILVGSYKNMLFMGVVVCNTAIGIIQEIRSKRCVDKLSILVSKKVTAIRNSSETEIPVEDIVIDDIIYLKRGAQVPSDCIVIEGECYANESLLTGESNLIAKNGGKQLYSGSFIASGECYARVNRVGGDNYAAKIHSEAKYIKKVNSEIMNTLKKIIMFCSVVIFPVGIAMFLSKYFYYDNTLQSAVVSTVGALVGMIPEGLVLLTSSVLAVSVVRLSKSKVLVQELYCIETLARVDTLCLDKTGTITCDKMEVTSVLPFTDNTDAINLALGSLCAASRDGNSTIRAVSDYCKGYRRLEPTRVFSFSSEKKWSGAVFEGGISYIMGAAEFIFSDREKYKAVFEKIASITEPVRIIAVAEISREITADDDLSGAKPLALVLLKDKIRSNAKETVGYFIEQGVNLKVISGDSVGTVSNIAREAGIPGYDLAVDASTLTTEQSLADAAEKYTVFGRVTPQQKKQLVKAMQKNGHTVAMTGDGVNDVLALKEADCSVAMAAGSEAARNVSQLVLTNNDFSAMPKVVAEGRRSINNIQRSGALFLVKTIYSIVLGIVFIFLSSSYPFQPIQLSFVGGLTVGLPSFVLALQPNRERVQGDFFMNVISRAIPAAFSIIMNVLITAFAGKNFGFGNSEISTVAVYLTALIGVLMVIRISVPFDNIRKVLLCVIIVGLVGGFVLAPEFLCLTPLNFFEWLFTVALGAFSFCVFNLLYSAFTGKAAKKYLIGNSGG